jgi:hypothetical protein
MGCGHLRSVLHPKKADFALDHFSRIVPACDTFGHSLAFFGERFLFAHFAAECGMRKADAIIRQPI